MLYQDNQKKDIIRVGVVALVFLIMTSAVILLYFSRQKSNNEINEEVYLNTYIDPVSGEQLDNPEGKSPESFDPDAPTISLLGFSDLLSVGFSVNQLESLIKALDSYGQSTSLSPNELSLYPNGFKFDSVEEAGLLDAVTLNIRQERKKDVRVLVYRYDLRTISIKVYDQNALVFESDKTTTN